MRQLLILAVMVLGLAPPAQADPLPVPPELKAFILRPDEKNAVLGLMGQQWHKIFENCATPKIQTMALVVIGPPKFDANGVPTSGEWRMVSHIAGCGETHIFSVEYLFTSDGQMKKVALLPGTTLADLRLEHDTLTYAAMAMARLKPEDCKDIVFLDTKFIAFDDGHQADPVNKRPWTEEWTVRTCAVTGVVPIHFVPDATGTVISAASARRVGP